MSNHPDHHSPSATDTLTGVRRPTEDDQCSPSTSVQSSSLATLLNSLVSPSPSSGYAGVTVDFLYRSPSTLYSETASGYGTVLAPPEQSLTPGSSSASFRQPLLVNDEPADMFPELGQSVASGAFEATQQEPSDYDAVMEEIMRAPVVRPYTCGESGDELFRISFASAADIVEMANIYADVSRADPLACCLIKRPKWPGVHVQAGRFYYGEAFAAKSEDVVLKVTNQNSGQIVGCAWLQLLPYPKSNKIYIRPWTDQANSTVPDCIKHAICPFIHKLRYKQIHRTIRRKERQTNDLPHYLIRSLDITNNLSTDDQLQVHRKLISFISGFKPEHQIFAQVSDAFQPEMITFLDLGWVFIGDELLDVNSCPKAAIPSLRDCPVVYRTLSGFLRCETAKPPGAETSRRDHKGQTPAGRRSRRLQQLQQQQSSSKRTNEESQQSLMTVMTPQSCQSDSIPPKRARYRR